MLRFLPVGKVHTIALTVSASLLLAACSTTPIPEGSDRIFGASENQNVNPFLPFITLKGENPVTLDVFSDYIDEGAIAESLEEGVLSASSISVTGFVDTNKVGSYELLFKATDSLGRIGKASRIVTIVDRVKPEISILQNQTETIERKGYGNLNAPDYVLSVQGRANVQMVDAYDGDISNDLVLEGSVPVTQEGDYQIFYNGVDSSNNAADQKIRTVQVRDTIPPGVSIQDFSEDSISFTESAQITVTFEDAAQIHDPFSDKIELISSNGGSVPECNLAISQNGMSRTITISQCNGSGSVKLRVLAGAARDATILPAANQTLQTDSVDVLTIANAAPVVTLNPPQPDLYARNETNTAIINVDFSTLVSGTIASNENEVESDTVSGNPNCSVTVSSTNPQDPNIQISNCFNNGEIRFRVKANAITSQNGNIPNAASDYSQTIIVDNLAPAVQMGTPTPPSNAYVTLNSTIVIPYSVTELYPVTAGPDAVVDINEVVISPASVNCNKVVTPTQIQLSNCQGPSLAFNVSIPSGALRDLSGNLSSTSTNNPTFNLDNIAPVVTVQTPTFNPPRQNNFMVGNSAANFGISYGTGEQINPANPLALTDLTITQNGSTCVTTPTIPNVRVDQCQGEGTYQFRVNANAVEDLAGNMNANPSNNSQLLNVDTVGPRATLGIPSDLLVKNSDSSTIIVTYTDLNFDFTALTSGGVTLRRPTGANASVGVVCGAGASLPPNQCRITLSYFTGNGEIFVSVNANTATDMAGTGSTASVETTPIVVDTIAPQISFMTGTNPWILPLCSTATNFLTDGIQVSDPNATLQVISNNVNRLNAITNYQVQFKATDQVGNEGFATRTVDVDGMLSGTDYEYGISTWGDLLGDGAQIRLSISSQSTHDFLLCNSINFDAYHLANGPSRPIGQPTSGNQVRGLKGIFEGQNYELEGIQILNSSTNDRSGLFAQLESNGGAADAEIRNLKIRDISVTSGTNKTGSLVGYSGGNILRVAVIGESEVNGASQLGGLVGEQGSSGDIDESFFVGKIMADDESDDVGGLLGFNDRGEIRNSFVVPGGPEENISGTNLMNVGGLVGRSLEGDISTSYAVPYGLCALQGSGSLGGLIGLIQNGTTVVDSFWDAEVAMNDPMTPLCDITAAYGNASTTAQMKTAATYPPSWLANLWRIDDNYYPDLDWFPLF